MLSKVFTRSLMFRSPVFASSAVKSCKALSTAAFSTESAGATKLQKVLGKELQFEQENYAQLEDTQTFLDQSGFKYSEDDNGLDCYLTKEVEGNTVTVHFLARQPSPQDEYENEEQLEGDNPEEPQDLYDGENYCDFSLFVQEGKTQKALIFDCTTVDTEISINSVMHTTKLEEVRKLSKFERSYSLYTGPEFNSLDERLQTGLVDYVQGNGVNEHLAAFVEVMSLDKDQRLYMNWLSSMKEFVE